MVIGVQDGKVRIWRDGRAQEVYRHEPRKGVSFVVVSSKLDRGASIGGDGGLYVFRLSDGKGIAEVKGHKMPEEYGALAMTPDGRLLFSGADRRLHVMDSRDGRILLSSNIQPHLRTALAVDRKGQRAAIADKDGRVTVVDVKPSGIEQVFHALADRGRTTGLSFSPDGDSLASVGLDGIVRIFDLEKNLRRSSFAIHGAWINDVRYSRDGRWLLTGSDDRTLAITDANTGVVQMRLDLGDQVITSDWSPDGRRIIATSGNLLEVFETPTDVFDEDPDRLVEEIPPALPPGPEVAQIRDTSRAWRDVPNVGPNQIGGVIASSPYSAPVPGALVEVLDGKTAAVLSSVRSDELGQYRLTVPRDPHGLRVTVGKKSRLVFGSVTEAGTADALIWEPYGGFTSAAIGAPVKVDPKKNLIHGIVRYGPRNRYRDMHDVGCARVAVDQDLPVFYTGRELAVDPKLRQTYPGFANFRIYNVEPNRPSVVTAEVGDKKMQYPIPPFPPGTAINVRIRFPAEQYPNNPTPADCFAPEVKRFE